MGMPANCACSGYSAPVPVSGKCCYYHLSSGWVCLDNVSETYCNTLFFGTFTPSGVGLDPSGIQSGVCPNPSQPYECYNSCFTAGSKVLMSGGLIKPIENIKEGDCVISYDGSFNNVTKKIDTTLGDRKLVRINGSKPFVTDDHPIMSDSGYKSFNADKSSLKYPYVNFTGEFNIGDKIATTGGYESINQFNLVDAHYTLPLHNLELDGDHTYIVEGYKVHNKSTRPPLIPPPSGEPYAEAVLSYWNLNEVSGIRVDSTPNDYYIGISANTTLTSTAGKINDGAYFNEHLGTLNTDLLLNTDDMVVVASSGFSVDGWVYFNAGHPAVEGDYGVLKLWSSFGDGFYLSRSSSTNKLSFVTSDNTTSSVVTHNTIVSNGSFSYFMCNYDGHYITINVNNGTPISGVCLYPPDPSTSKTFTLGNGSSSNVGMSGILDEVAVYSGVLDGSFRYNSGYGTGYPFT